MNGDYEKQIEEQAATAVMYNGYVLFAMPHMKSGKTLGFRFKLGRDQERRIAKELLYSQKIRC